MSPLHILSRAFSSNLRAINVTSEEQAELAAAGIAEPTVQRFVVWRRATIWMVVIATILSAGLSTYRTLTEDDDQPDVMETLTDRFLERVDRAVPGASGLVAEEEEGEDEPETTIVGKVVDGAHLISVYALPIAAVIVLLLGNRFRTSYRVLIIAFVFSFFMPMLVSVCPWSWWGYDEPKISAADNPLKFFQNETEGLLEGASTFLLLLPAVLSLIPGVQRACLRVKTLLPESLLPGWFIVVASPLYGLFLFVLFVAIDQVTGDPVILLSLVLIVLAPLVFLARASVFTKPLLIEDDVRRMQGVQRIVGALTAVGGLLLVGYAVTRQVVDMHVVGQDPVTSLLRPIEVVEYLFEIVSRSMFVTVLGADLFMRMNLNAWKQHRALAASSAAPAYDGVMEATERVV